MRYEVRVRRPDGIESRFELERDEPLAVGDIIIEGSMAYKATSLQPGIGEFDAVLVAEWFAGPAEFGQRADRHKPLTRSSVGDMGSGG